MAANRTFSIIKPDATRRNLTGAVTKMLEDAGLRVVASKRIHMTKEQADALKGVQLFADRDRLPSLPDDEFYHADLIGLVAQDTGGAELGRVLAVHNHGAGDMLEISAPGRKARIRPKVS